MSRWISGAGLAKVEHQTEKKRSRGRSPSPSEAFLASYLRTMADALVSIVLEKLTHVLGQQLSLFASATRELEKLRDTFQSIQAVLADAESRQVADKSVRLWLLTLRKVAYDIEDLLIAALEKDGRHDDDHEEDDDGSVGNAGNRVAAALGLPSPYACFDQTVSRYKLAQKMKEIRERLDQIAKNKDQFNNSQLSSFGGDPRTTRRSRTMTTSHMDEEMIGRQRIAMQYKASS
ncbi:hypothetical protein ACLOJK_007801 [Asimina triloba]